MSLIHSYALWNNKGGVGKSTITFHLSMRFVVNVSEYNKNTPTNLYLLCGDGNLRANGSGN